MALIALVLAKWSLARLFVAADAAGMERRHPAGNQIVNCLINVANCTILIVGTYLDPTLYTQRGPGLKDIVTCTALLEISVSQEILGMTIRRSATGVSCSRDGRLVAVGLQTMTGRTFLLFGLASLVIVVTGRALVRRKHLAMLLVIPVHTGKFHMVTCHAGHLAPEGCRMCGTKIRLFDSPMTASTACCRGCSLLTLMMTALTFDLVGLKMFLVVEDHLPGRIREQHTFGQWIHGQLGVRCRPGVANQRHDPQHNAHHSNGCRSS